MTVKLLAFAATYALAVGCSDPNSPSHQSSKPQLPRPPAQIRNEVPSDHPDSTHLPLLRRLFTERDKAISRGVEIRNAVKKGTPIPFLFGEEVVFWGSGLPPGGTADLIIEEGVKLIVEIEPFKDVRPPAAMWEASVLGVMQKINQPEKTIWIKARPEDWKVLETW